MPPVNDLKNKQVNLDYYDLSFSTGDMKTEPLRAFLLELGDEFIMLGVKYRVTNISKVAITYHNIHSLGKKAHINTFGINSRQRVLLICKSQPPSKVVYERPEALYDNKSAMGVADEFRA